MLTIVLHARFVLVVGGDYTPCKVLLLSSCHVVHVLPCFLGVCVFLTFCMSYGARVRMFM